MNSPSARQWRAQRTDGYRTARAAGTAIVLALPVLAIIVGAAILGGPVLVVTVVAAAILVGYLLVIEAPRDHDERGGEDR